MKRQLGLLSSISSSVGALDANLYQYTLGNPLSYADPLGLWSFTATAFSHGWGGVGASVTAGADDSGGFIDVTAGVGVGAGFSFDPNGTAPVAAADGTPASAWVGFGGALGAQAGPFSAGVNGFLGGAYCEAPPSFDYAPQAGPQFGVGSWGFGAYGVGGVRVGASGL